MNQLLKFAHQTVDEKMVPGMVIGIIDDNQTTIDVYGLAGYPDEPLNKDMQYDIASMTKLFTATRILQLIEDDALDYKTLVKDILPEFKNNEITIEHLLLHRSGMKPSLTGRYTMSHDEMVQSILNCDDLENPVDTVMNYSCINFMILGLIIEAVDESLDDAIKHHITEPLNMMHTEFLPENKANCVPTEDSPKRGMIRGVVHDETAHNFGGICGNAGLFSTIDDLVKFANGYLKRTILTPETIQILLQTNVDNRSMGWNIHQFEGKDYLYHTGFTGPSILLDIENQRSLIILTNRVHPTRENPAYIERRLELFNVFLKK